MYEEAAESRAVDVLPAGLLKGANHTVDDRVRNDGYLNYYRIHSDYGEFEAVSTAMLRTRIREINALAELAGLSQTEVFIQAAADAGVGQIKALTQFATHPLDTVTGVPRGIGRMFNRFTRQAGDAVDATAEMLAGEEDGKDGEEDSTSSTEKAVDLGESFFGVSSAERAWAQKLGTDPYSSNATLRAAIKDVAWAERLGRFGIGFAGIPEIPGADIIGEVNDAVWSKDPYELQDLNRARLVATGAEESLIEAFFENPWMSPSQQTLLTAAISEIDGAGGRDGILREALNVESDPEANFLIKSVTMLAWYHIHRKPIDAVLTDTAVPVGVTEDGTVVLMFAVDHVYWTQTVAVEARKRAARASALPSAAKEVWLLGSASNRTHRELADLGFLVHQEVAALMMTAPD